MSSLSSLGNLSSLSNVDSGSIASLNTSGIQFSGLASGLDSNKIIQGLVAVQQARIDQLKGNQSKVQQQQAAFKTIEAKLLTLQGQSDSLARTFGGVFDAKTVTASNPDQVTATASSSAVPGVYTFRINNLARAEELASQGYADPNSAITQGTIQLKVGSGATRTITVDSTNNTLGGLANAINNARGDVTASIVNDGSGTTPYRLLLTAKNTGAANTITVTNNLAATAGRSNPDLSTIVQQAADASLTVGSGAGALNVASADNQVDGLFAGVTLNLLAADPTKDITVTVANDSAGANKAVHGLVDAYNDLADTLNQDTSFDAKTGQAGLLLGNLNAIGIQDSLTTVFSSAVSQVNPQANRLAAVGVTLDDQGKLQVDDGKLNKALSGQLAGVSAADVRRLFALDGTSTNNGVQFVIGSDKTQASATPYQVDISRAATQASITATNPLAGSIVIGNSNNTLLLTVDGRASSTLTLASGTYTPQTLAQEVQAKINADTQLAGANVAVGVNNNSLTITSSAFGSASQVTVNGGTALAALGLAGTESSRGLDVAGKFIVNGVDELATGTGQILIGVSTNAHTSGLQVRVTLNAAQVGAGPEANVTVTRGIASKLGQVLNSYLDPVNGRLETLDHSLQDNVDSIQKTIDQQNAALQAREQALVNQFATLEGTIAQLKATGDYLSAQFTSVTSTGK